MPVECPTGWMPHTLPTTPRNSRTLQQDNTYVHVTYEWELADNSTPPTCACGQACTFNFGYGYTSDGSVTVTPWGVGGATSAGLMGYTELSVNVGPDDYEYIGYKVVLKETTETGTVSMTGGFAPRSGFWNRLKYAWRFFWYGWGAVFPTITYNAPDTTTTKYIQAAWKICRRPCPVTDRPPR